MPVTEQELANIANAALDFHDRSGVKSNVIQSRPLVRELMKRKKKFPGGKEFITVAVKGVYSTSLQGYSYDDEVQYVNPANIKRAQAKWYEMHAGISVTLTELKNDGISVVDSMDSARTTEHSMREKTAIANLFQDKLEDMEEGTARSMDEMFWRDGTQDPKLIPGITSFILDSPASAGSTFGIDRTANTWFRNRANLLINASTPADQNTVQAMQKDFRQLRRYGKGPTNIFAGSDFMDAFEKELRSKGNYTLEGWAKNGQIDASVADIAFKGMMVEYVPELDDLGKSKYAYGLDLNAIRYWEMEDEGDKRHSPARPPEKYVLYRAITNTGGLLASQLNTSQVWSIA